MCITFKRERSVNNTDIVLSYNDVFNIHIYTYMCINKFSFTKKIFFNLKMFQKDILL